MLYPIGLLRHDGIQRDFDNPGHRTASMLTSKDGFVMCVVPKPKNRRAWFMRKFPSLAGNFLP
jgi:hypothetical protein